MCCVHHQCFQLLVTVSESAVSLPRVKPPTITLADIPAHSPSFANVRDDDDVDAVDHLDAHAADYAFFNRV